MRLIIIILPFSNWQGFVLIYHYTLPRNIMNLLHVSAGKQRQLNWMRNKGEMGGRTKPLCLEDVGILWQDKQQFYVGSDSNVWNKNWIEENIFYGIQQMSFLLLLLRWDIALKKPLLHINSDCTNTPLNWNKCFTSS